MTQIRTTRSIITNRRERAALAFLLAMLSEYDSILKRAEGGKNSRFFIGGREDAEREWYIIPDYDKDGNLETRVAEYNPRTDTMLQRSFETAAKYIMAIGVTAEHFRQGMASMGIYI